MTYDVCGLGNALFDVLVRIPSEGVLAQNQLNRGQMHLVDAARWQRIYDSVESLGLETSPGGSCANVISTAALLGASTTFCGQVGQDTFGHTYAESLASVCNGHHLHLLPTGDTGRCLSLISPDAERTMATNLGCAIELAPHNLFYEALAESRFFHLTGYLFTGGEMGLTGQVALEQAKTHRSRISFDVADAWVISATRDRIWDIIHRYANVVFTNADEAEALFGCPPEEAVDALARECDIAVVKLGRRGSLIRSGDVRLEIPAYEVPARDTTGAGDSYAGGFLFALSRGYDLEKCGRIASRVAAEAVSQTGAVVSTPGRLKEIVRDL